jgi:flavodoxin
MKGLVVYDSLYGNTEKVAKAIGEELSSEIEDLEVLSTEEANHPNLESVDLLVIGSPTHGGRASPKMKEFLDDITNSGLKGKKVGAFDTRTDSEGEKIWIRMIMKILGFAAGRIGKTLEGKGGKLTVEPEGFNVSGREGPLIDGEIERARSWAKKIIRSLDK